MHCFVQFFFQRLGIKYSNPSYMAEPNDKVKFDEPFQELFIWAVLYNKWVWLLSQMQNIRENVCNFYLGIQTGAGEVLVGARRQVYLFCSRCESTLLETRRQNQTVRPRPQGHVHAEQGVSAT